MTRRRNPHSWTVVRLPERDLAELVLGIAAPLLERLGPAPAIEAWMRAVQSQPLPASVRIPSLGAPPRSVDPAAARAKKNQRKAARQARKKNR